ncbi:hypothetical protein POTOM_057951 [Populus tomentosa]|uniref:Uncharacterized protein n=1 Tax=Populus tomentosa TaxID=118781 RepID=A0A8X7XQ69_POPTO|nr:hypothetical protein POTOM_057951 [Populus tomentosa]
MTAACPRCEGKLKSPAPLELLSVFSGPPAPSPFFWHRPLLFIGLDSWWFICHRLFLFRMRISVAWGVGVLVGLGHQQSRHSWTVGGGL